MYASKILAKIWKKTQVFLKSITFNDNVVTKIKVIFLDYATDLSLTRLKAIKDQQSKMFIYSKS